MTTDYQRLWDVTAGATDKARAVQSLAKILADEKGRAFISRLDERDAGLCIEILGDVSYSLRSPFLLPQTSRQGIAVHKLKPAEKQASFVTLRKLAGRHGLLPNRMKIAEKIHISDEVLAFNALADLRCGTCEGRPVAVKTMRVTAQDDFMKIRKVSSDATTQDTVSTTLSQRFCKEVVLWSTLSHQNILKLVGVQEDMDKRQLTAVSEWMSRGNIMEFIEDHHVNRLELVRGFTFPATSSLKCGDSCTVQPRVSSTSMTPVSHTGPLKGSVFIHFSIDTLLTFPSRTSSCLTTPLFVPASRTSVL